MTAFDWTSTTLLIIDSDRAFNNWVKDLFYALGTKHCVFYQDSAEALNAVRRGLRPDIILLELEFPKVPSPVLIRQFRNPEIIPVPDIPIIVTGKNIKTVPGLMRSACLSGIENFIKKPPSSEHLISRIQKTILRPKRFVVSRTYFGPDRRQDPPADPNYQGPERRKPRNILTDGTEQSETVIPELGNAALPSTAMTTGPIEVAEPSADQISSNQAIELLDSGANSQSKAQDTRDISEKFSDQKSQSQNLAGSEFRDGVSGSPLTNRKPAQGPAHLPEPSKNTNAGAHDHQQEMQVNEPKDIVERDPSISSIDMNAIIQAHTIWIDSHGEKGQKATLEGEDLGGTDLSGVNLKNANVRRTILADANLTGSIFEAADMRSADLSGSIIANGNFAVANMRHANMKATNLERATLRGVDLAGACLANAKLIETDFSGANLLSTDLRDTDLSAALGLTQRQIGKIITNAQTKLPIGLRLPKTD